VQKLLVFYGICKEARAPAAPQEAEIEVPSSLRERNLAKVGVAGSRPFARFNLSQQR
jgi:hypothetical protein